MCLCKLLNRCLIIFIFKSYLSIFLASGFRDDFLSFDAEIVLGVFSKLESLIERFLFPESLLRDAIVIFM